MHVPFLANLLNVLSSADADAEGQEGIEESAELLKSYIASVYPNISGFFDSTGAAKAFATGAFTWPAPAGDGRWELAPRIRAVFNLSRFAADRLLADALLRSAWFYLSCTVDAPAVWTASGREPIDPEYARLAYRAVVETEADWWWLNAATSHDEYGFRIHGMLPVTAAKSVDGSCYLGPHDMWGLIDRANDPSLWPARR